MLLRGSRVAAPFLCIVGVLALGTVMWSIAFTMQQDLPQQEHHVTHHMEHQGVHDHNMHEQSGMAMYYHWSEDAIFLFPFWDTHGNRPMYYSSLVLLFLLSCLCEGLPVAFSWRQSAQERTCIKLLAPIVAQNRNTAQQLCKSTRFVTRLVVGYQIMLVVMTYNVGASIAVFSGTFVGHFIFVRFL